MFRAPTSINRTAAIAIAALSFLGFVDAGYLSYYRFFGINVPCGTSNACAIVNASEFSSILGVPLSYLGVIFYLAIMLIMLAGALEFKSLTAYRLGTTLTLFSFLTAAYLFYVQAALIGVFCPYCIASGIFSLLMFLTSAWEWWRRPSTP